MDYIFSIEIESCLLMKLYDFYVKYVTTELIKLSYYITHQIYIHTHTHARYIIEI